MGKGGTRKREVNGEGKGKGAKWRGREDNREGRGGVEIGDKEGEGEREKVSSHVDGDTHNLLQTF